MLAQLQCPRQLVRHTIPVTTTHHIAAATGKEQHTYKQSFLWEYKVVTELISTALMGSIFHLRYTLNTSWWPRGIGTHYWFFSLQVFLNIVLKLVLSQEHKMHFKQPLFYLTFETIYTISILKFPSKYQN